MLPYIWCWNILAAMRAWGKSSFEHSAYYDTNSIIFVCIIFSLGTSSGWWFEHQRSAPSTGGILFNTQGENCMWDC
jgi:hypothetical protein